MTFIIDPNLPPEWKDSFKDFEQKYGHALSTNHPELSSMNIEVRVFEKLNDFLSDENNPLQANIDKDFIAYSENTIDLSPMQREALIAHEIGHLIHKDKYGKDSERLEMECDKVATELNLNVSLKEALEALIENYQQQLKDPFTKEFVGGNINETSDSMKRRIDSL